MPQSGCSTEKPSVVCFTSSGHTCIFSLQCCHHPPTHATRAVMLLQKYDAKASPPRTVVVMHHRSSSQKNVVRATWPGRPRVTTWGFSCSVIITASYRSERCDRLAPSLTYVRGDSHAHSRSFRAGGETTSNNEVTPHKKKLRMFLLRCHLHEHSKLRSSRCTLHACALHTKLPTDSGYTLK